jgi:hypothetical protein
MWGWLGWDGGFLLISFRPRGCPGHSQDTDIALFHFYQFI